MTRPGLDHHTTTNKNKGWDFHWENAQVHEQKPLAAQLRCCALCSQCGVTRFKYAFIKLYNPLCIARQQRPVACAADCWIGHKTRQPSAPLRLTFTNALAFGSCLPVASQKPVQQHGKAREDSVCLLILGSWENICKLLQHSPTHTRNTTKNKRRQSTVCEATVQFLAPFITHSSE